MLLQIVLLFVPVLIGRAAYSDLAFVHADYSLIYYYSSLATSNNDDFINLVKTLSNPSLTSPIVKVGIGARNCY